MYRGQIPGYYYDPQKKKYFRVVPNHTGGRYSNGTVAEIEKQKHKSRVQEKHKEAIRQQLTRRNGVLSAPLAGGAFLSRELGQHPYQANTLETWTQAYGSGLINPWVCCFGQPVSALAYDPATGDFLLGSRCPSGHANLSAFPYSRPSSKTPQRSRILEAFASASISSISISPARVAAVTGTGGPRAMITFVSLADLEEFSSSRAPEIECDISVSFMIPSETTVWSSAANPFIHNQSSFVVGMSDGAMQFTDAEASWDHVKSDFTHSDVMAVEWLTPTVVSLGQRNGGVKLWDVRSSGSAMRLQHPGRITGLRRVDNHTLVACGLESSLAMYDLRMPVAAETSKPPAAKRRHKLHTRPARKDSTKPVRYFDHANERSIPLGFDVDCDNSLVAAGNHKGGIDLFSLHTGEKINNGNLQQLRAALGPVTRPDSLTNVPGAGDTNLVYNLQFCQKPQTERQPSEPFLFGSTWDRLFSLGWQKHMTV